MWGLLNWRKSISFSYVLCIWPSSIHLSLKQACCLFVNVFELNRLWRFSTSTLCAFLSLVEYVLLCYLNRLWDKGLNFFSFFLLGIISHLKTAVSPCDYLGEIGRILWNVFKHGELHKLMAFKFSENLETYSSFSLNMCNKLVTACVLF